ncbi:YrbL family protein [Vibrio sinaloensis]|uniref:Protein kinase domain-containing protein n=1 Tax=Photobacterium sp. (strain ATCC 43367) TaxID=379097 RepID=A0A0A5I313_PHOS4|nr:YrbL family protein [Vibrio sinaloensis]KGY10216.1 hypothetical protein NM06_04720 [Vibrio sinaloensis]
MLVLKDIIGKGNERLCFKHPEFESKCVKVTYNQKRGRSDESKIEHNYFKKVKKRVSNLNDVPIALVHHWVDTDQGKGLLCDRVNDYCGKVSKSLDYYRKNQLISTRSINHGIERLLEKLVQHAICINYIHDRNILVQFTNENDFRFILIDGLGNTNLIPLGYWFKKFARKQTARRFYKKYPEIYNTYKSYKN